MYIAMNRFRIVPGQESAFEEIWRQRESYLDTVPGFCSFHLLKGPEKEEFSLYATHTVWDSIDDFESWTHSEQFRKAHANARTQSQQTKSIYLGPPQFEGFESILAQSARNSG
ncbi:antibiotic biosynthesis monooxygenase [Motiliproteus sp. MSK22-1]|uniref:antibiotic biosynthesis monooxygenase family protein n=1 Tax=Motiliproteus sp. MSK22-1 TaxID=1897630 RepID=UPI000977DC47|nr:antibiotic biosynthesis monooxygenase [Motiliproteus sp. MSK22-1]OMH39055.1 antibiotic biosynthesis monooxygenase [Motiliproteus sp. MSK22-1]